MAYGTLLSHSCATRPKKNGLKLQENQAVIFGWRPCVLFRNILIFIVIFVINFTQGSIKGPKKA